MITLQGENRVSLESAVFLSTSSASLFILSSGSYTIYKPTNKTTFKKFHSRPKISKSVWLLRIPRKEEMNIKNPSLNFSFSSIFSGFSATNHRTNQNPQTSTCFLPAEALVLRTGVLWSRGFGWKEHDPCGLKEGRLVLLIELEEVWNWRLQKNCDDAIAIACTWVFADKPHKTRCERGFCQI